MDPVIKVDNLGKEYRVGTRGTGYQTFREALLNAAAASLNRIKGKTTSENDVIWALDGVTFDVSPGEVLGIIGRNGAGKSTLLKILSRITEPTRGEVEMVGRTSSLLDLGTGIHSELTGRENVYLNGAILGMKRREIDRKFDEIVSFAEIGEFIDTPVKRYSNGMALRLGFAVAAHLDPDILMVDEVLAVGDAQFQRKCLAQMDRVSRQGRTVVFVSHQMRAVKMFCSRVIHLERGKIVNDGSAQEVVHHYLAGGRERLDCTRVWPSPGDAPGDQQFQLRAMRAVDESGEPCDTFYSSQPILVQMEFDLAFLHSALKVGFALLNGDGVIVFQSDHNDLGEQEWPALRVGRNILQCRVPPGLLSQGSYSISPKVSLHCIKIILNGDPEIGFHVQVDHSNSPFWSTERSTDFRGVIAPCLPWTAVETGERLTS